MKILHTSDWHLGHILYNDSQERAQQDMLNQIATIIAEKQPDALVISGDIYDTTQPSAAVQQMFANAIVKMHDANKNMTIVCIAGNHDSGSKHMIFHTPWRALNVHMIGSIVKDSNLDDYIIPVEGKGYIVAVPFAAERFMPDNVFTVLSDKVKILNTENLPVILCAHLAVANSDWRGHDFSSDTNIGGLNCQELKIFGNDYDYIALGHIHKQQKLDKEGHIWYAGTPIAVSFDESYKGNDHGVLLIECSEHTGKVNVDTLPIQNINPLVNLPADGSFADWEKVKEELIKYDNEIPSFIRLNVEVDGYLPVGANDEAQQLIENKKCRLSIINSKRKGKNEKTSQIKTFTPTELKQIDFMEVAKMYIESLGKTFTDDMIQMLQEVKTELTNNND